MKHERDFAGRWHHTFRQSDLSTYMMCPEMLRTEGDHKTHEHTDATLIGEAVHLAVETYLRSEGNEKYLEHLSYIACEYVKKWWPETRIIQCDTLDDALSKVHTCLEAFWENRDQFPLGGLIEEPFTMDNVYGDAFRTISMTGTPDYVHLDTGMIYDWKTSAEDYARGGWKLDRYAVQPTVYVAAMSHKFGKDFDFTFVRLPKDGKAMETRTVERNLLEWVSVIELAVSLAHVVESGMPVWPMRPSDWHCSAKWCDTHRAGACRGRHMNGAPYNAPWVDLETQVELLEKEGK